MKEVFNRAFETAECRTQVELAGTLDIQQSSVSDAKWRNSIPSDWLLKLLRLKRANPEWILTGEGPRFMVPSDSADMGVHVVYLTEIKLPEQSSAQDLINELVRRALHKKDNSEIADEVARCLVPLSNGVCYASLRREELWDTYSMLAPERLRRCVERYKIVKKA